MVLQLGNEKREFKEKVFGFIGDDGSTAIENKQNITIEELFLKNMVIFTTQKCIVAFSKESEDIFKNKDDRILTVSTEAIMFKNFNEMCGYASLEELKELFNFKGITQADIMKEYIGFLRGLGIRRNQIALSSESRLAETVLYHGINRELFNGNKSNNNLPKTKKERRKVFNYYKEKLKEKNNGLVYGVLDCQKGEFKDVFMVDLNNFYGYQVVSKKFLSNNPHQVLFEGKEPQYSYVPNILRQRFINNYKDSKNDNNPKGIQKFFKKCNNLTIGRNENLNTYLERSRETPRNFLGPQYGFEIISKGIDDMNEYTEIFKKFGANIIKRDTDGIAMTGINRELGEQIVNLINEEIVKRLKMAGLSEEDANCGIGQFKIEGYANKYYQFGNKCYCYQIDGENFIKFSGLPRKERKILISLPFEELVGELKKRPTEMQKTIKIENRNLELVRGFM